MTSVIFNSGLIGFIIWLLLFFVSTAALALILRCAWSLRKIRFPVFPFAIDISLKNIPQKL